MKKLSLKALSVFTFVVLSLGSLVTFAQGTPSGFGNAAETAGISGIAWVGTQQWWWLITVIKTFINWALGMLALVALVILLMWGFQMVTAAGDDAKYKKGFKILQQAAVGLVFIGVSWMMVSLIFWVLWIVGAGATG
ncbi:MAG: hypothetical protein ACD_80C00145G0011 [uncultured bacterium (gcode 4)]|uniref:Uncharacterized protein n=1 Tax=uncultured bacterium (gcode 4) TaxID=1234023 RepID=K1XI98_9BACT|nr:MAG: hypothetical protein ACD_80C00145G0011 [uncultured bacterium (gcode 4)]